MLDELQLQFQERVNRFLGISLSEEVISQFELFFDTLVEWNQKMNLTAITERKEVYYKHFYDSITILTADSFACQGRTLDVGAGAGFPGVPVQLVCRELPLTVIDSLSKRITFLHELGKKLKLDDFSPIHGRAEDFGKQVEWRETFDQVFARAVAKLNVLSEYCLPFVRVGGFFFALKGSDADLEVAEGEKAIKKLGGEIRELKKIELPDGYGSHTIIVIEKIKNTPPQFPRKAGMPSKKPLM